MRSAAEIFFKVRKTGDLPVGVNVWNLIKAMARFSSSLTPFILSLNLIKSIK